MNQPNGGGKTKFVPVRLLQGQGYIEGNYAQLVIDGQEVKVLVQKHEVEKGSIRTLDVLAVTRTDTEEAMAVIVIQGRDAGVGTDPLIGQPMIIRKLLSLPAARPDSCPVPPQMTAPPEPQDESWAH